MQKEIYLDNNATTKPDPLTIKAMMPYLETFYGNPSSTHKKGIEANRALQKSRQTIAQAIKVQEKEIIFTSGATESNNLAIKGVVKARKRAGTHIITTKVEHPSVLEPYRKLEKEGFSINYITVTKDGINPEELKQMITNKTILVSIMHINNETGQILPIEELARQIKQINPNTIIHSDGTQAFGKVEINLEQIDLYSISGHKIHAPKGVGILYKKNNKSEKIIDGTSVTIEPKPFIIIPNNTGGGQEQGLRGGTENIPGIIATAKATELAYEKIKETQLHLQKINALFIEKIKNIPNITINSPKESIPSTINISIPPIPGEIIVNMLNEKGIYVSTGAACTSNVNKNNYVLEAMKYPKKIINSSIRVSTSRYTTEEEIIETVKVLNQLVKQFKK